MTISETHALQEGREPATQFGRPEFAIQEVEVTSEFTELACHPGRDSSLNTPYRLERFMEVETLCDVRVRATLEAEQIKLCSFHDVGTHAS